MFILNIFIIIGLATLFAALLKWFAPKLFMLLLYVIMLPAWLALPFIAAWQIRKEKPFGAWFLFICTLVSYAGIAFTFIYCYLQSSSF
ncbi:MAG: hypothetical protein LBR10_07140 [Prevotellaceae bacterium]|jgi:hypothetical protein|nr:hypothetical protein [Prevotellaceae bacterium]